MFNGHLALKHLVLSSGYPRTHVDEGQSFMMLAVGSWVLREESCLNIMPIFSREFFGGHLLFLKKNLMMYFI